MNNRLKGKVLDAAPAHLLALQQLPVLSVVACGCTVYAIPFGMGRGVSLW